ncbi:MAG: hypothetical protein AAF657_08445 [Acidobacteriota bacterium]
MPEMPDRDQQFGAIRFERSASEVTAELVHDNAEALFELHSSAEYDTSVSNRHAVSLFDEKRDVAKLRPLEHRHRRTLRL